MSRIQLDPDAFARNQRLAIYEIANTWLEIAADMQRTTNLRPDALQIYILIGISSIQAFARAPQPAHLDGEPLPVHLTGSISRRRLADVSGLPRETVARHVRHLIDRGLVIERGRGCLAVPPGVLKNVAPTGVLERMAGKTASLANALVRLGVLKPAGTAD